MSKLLLLTSLALIAAAPVTDETTTPAVPDVQVVEQQRLMLPEPLRVLREAHSERLSLLQTEFAKEKDPARARELQRAIRNEKLGFEASLLEYQIERAQAAHKTEKKEQLQQALDMIRGLMNDEREEDITPSTEGDQ